MSFKENLLKKITLGEMKGRVLSSLGPVGSGSKVDKKAMKALLSAGGFRCVALRGLELYLREGTDDGEAQTILVLDNDLPVYHSTLSDVAMRKEPTIKEMISIRNAIRILSDKDVVMSHKEASVELVYREGLSRLDLAFGFEEIKMLEYEGRGCVDGKDADGVLEILSLFGELLGFGPEPSVFRVERHHIRGGSSRAAHGGELFGPAVVYDADSGALRWINERVAVTDTAGIQRFREKAQGKIEPDCSGSEVMKSLSGEVMRRYDVSKGTPNRLCP